MKRRPVCLVCLILMLCIWLMDVAGFTLISGNPLPESVQHHIEEHPDAVICGEIQQYQDTEYSLSVYLKHVFLVLGPEQIPIKNLKVFLKSNKELPVGTTVKMKGRLERVPEPRNPGEFDSRQYYACQKIYYYMKDAVICEWSSTYSQYGQFVQTLKERMMHILDTAAGDDAGIYQAMLLGEKRNLDSELKIRYQMAGIIHILAISGLHISVMGIGFFDLLKKAGLGNGLAGILALSVLLQYGILTGESVSAMRAVCMFLLAVGARIAGRTYDLLTALAVSAVILIIDAPANLYNSGFWLSFGAVTGIGVVSPVLTNCIQSKNQFVKSLLVSLAIQLTTLPIMLRIYGEISLAGFVLNLFVLPTVGTVLVSGIAAVIGGMVWVGIAPHILIPGRALLFLYGKICEVVSTIPYCTWIGGSPTLQQCICYYGLLAVGTGILWKYERDCWQYGTVRKSEENDVVHRRRRLASAGISGVAILIGLWVLIYRPTGNLKITCLDIGQGDCISVSLPSGENFLIDGGSSNKKNIAQYQILPYLKNQGIAVIDAIMISHTDNDHISGILELLEYIEKNLTSVHVRNLILPEWKEKNEAYSELEIKAKNAGIKVQKGRQGETLQLGESKLKFLAPVQEAAGTDVNEDGMVVQMEYGKFKALFTGDIGEETEKKLLADLEDIDFLKVGHHGSRYSTCEEFLDVIQPELAVISCSDSNTYGHPSEETIERLEEAGAEVRYTMKEGAVSVITDGKKIEIQSFVQQ